MAKYCSLTLILLCLLLVLFLVSGNTETMRRAKNSYHYKQANYHLKMLGQSVERIKRSLSVQNSRYSSHHVSKRSTKFAAGDLILNSLSSYCLAFKSDPNIVEYFEKYSNLEHLKSRDISKSSRYQPDENRLELNTSFPVKVLAERDNDKVWYIFDIAHLGNAHITRVDPFYYQASVLEKPKDSCFKVVSQARFAVDVQASICKESTYSLKELEAGFQINQEGNSDETITVYTDLCKFDKHWDNIEEQIRTKDEIISQDKLKIPSFSMSQPFKLRTRLLSNLIDESTGSNYDSMEFPLQVNISHISHLSIRLVLWDTAKTNITQSSVKIRPHNENDEEIMIEYDGKKMNDGDDDVNEDRLFSVKVMSKSIHEKTIITSMRIILTAGHLHNRSGRLSLRYQVSSPKKTLSSSIIKRFRVDKHFPVNVDNDSSELPKGLVYFSPKRRFFCDVSGNKDKYGRHAGSGNRNCTVECNVFGRGISSIYITTPHSIKSPTRTTSFVFHSNAVAMADLGPAPSDIEGDYQCTAVTNRGESIKHDMKLYTSRFIRVKSFELHWDNGDPETVDAICIVSGHFEGLDIAILVTESGMNETRLDNVEGSFLEKNITHDNKKDSTTMVLRIPWANLRVPKDRITCLAEGERGNNKLQINLGNFVQNYRGIYPMIDRSLFKTEDFINGTKAISCTATGKLPMSVSINFSGDVHYRKTIIEHVDGVSKTATYYVENYNRHYRVRYDCYAKNEYDKVTQFFYE